MLEDDKAIGAIILGSDLIASCSPTRVLNSLTSNDGYTIRKNISYAEGNRHSLDICTPAPSVDLKPIIVFLYGGSWEEGNTESYLFVGSALAMRWVQDHSKKYGGDPKRIILMGHFAGAHIAVMLTFNHSYLDKVGFERPRLKALVGLSGPYDFLSLRSDTLKIFFSLKETRGAGQPINFVGSDTPPAFLATGKMTKPSIRKTPHVWQSASRKKALTSPSKYIQVVATQQ